MAINTISLFSGGGGLDLGFQQADYHISWAMDNEPNAVRTYQANLGDHIIMADINNLDEETLPNADLVIGGPPCQAFSLAGNRRATDPRALVVWKYISVINRVRPHAFVFENVTGLLSARNQAGERVLDLLHSAFKSIGYSVTMQIMNAADYGVPQRRRRLFIVGLRSGDEFVFPEPTHSEGGLGQLRHVSVEEAIGDLGDAATEDGTLVGYRHAAEGGFQRIMQTAGGQVSDHIVPRMSSLDRFICKHVKPGGNYMDIPSTVDSQRIRRLQRTGGHTTCYGRMEAHKPAYTINTYFQRPNVGCNIHYREDRLITVREALRLQSFPDWYQIQATSKQSRNAIVGNAVPPLLARALAIQLKYHFT